MATLQWDRAEDRRFEYGVDHGVLYTEYMNGDPSMQTLDRVMREGGSGLEFFHGGYSVVEDRINFVDVDELVVKNVYNRSLNFSWGTMRDPSVNQKWTAEKGLSKANGTTLINDPYLAVSDYISLSYYSQEISQQGLYAFWFWCANSEIFPIDIYFYGSQSNFLGVKTATGSSYHDGGAYVVVPQNIVSSLTAVRLVIHGYRNDRATGAKVKTTAITLFMPMQHTEDELIREGVPQTYIEQWAEACTTYYNDEDLTEPIPDHYYKFGGSIFHGGAWNGLTSVTENPDGAEPNDLWADNIKYASLRSAESFGATIEAYQAPPEFAECDGTRSPVSGVFLGHQKRKPFGFAYRSKTETEDGYKIHIIYNATASPSEKSYETINDSPDAITFSWEVDTTPVAVGGFKPVSSIIIDPEKFWGTKASEVPSEDPGTGFYPDGIRDRIHVLEALLFGTSQSGPFLPSPAFVYAILGEDPPFCLRQLAETPVETDEPIEVDTSD